MLDFITTEQFVEKLASESYHVWNGAGGYDTRPYMIKNTGNVFLPVAYWEGNAANQVPDTGDVPVGDILAAVQALNVGAIIVVPSYSGCHYCGEDSWILTPAGWNCYHSYQHEL